MERGSAKHNPKLDEELKRETRSLEQGAPVESHVEEFRQQEAAADGEPIPDARLTSVDPRPGEVEAHADLARYLVAVRYPTQRADLERSAAQANAPEPVKDAITALDPRQRFANFEDVWRAAGPVLTRSS